MTDGIKRHLEVIFEKNVQVQMVVSWHLGVLPYD
jgi:hypothetical protein